MKAVKIFRTSRFDFCSKFECKVSSDALQKRNHQQNHRHQALKRAEKEMKKIKFRKIILFTCYCMESPKVRSRSYHADDYVTADNESCCGNLYNQVDILPRLVREKIRPCVWTVESHHSFSHQQLVTNGC